MNDPRLELAAAASDHDASRVLDELDRIRPIVRAPRKGGLSHGHASAAAAAVLARIFPHTVVEGDAPLGVNPWGVERLAGLSDALEPVRPRPSRGPAIDVVLALDGDAKPADIWVAGWDLTAVMARTPVPLGDTRVTLGPQAAAVLAAGEVLKVALEVLGVPANRLPTAGSLTWNLLDYRLTPAGALEAAPVVVDGLAVLGCGSVGSSATAVIAMQPMSGQVQAVDGDVIDPQRNPFRYPALLPHEPIAKARWASDLLVAGGWELADEPFVGSVGQWVATRAEVGYRGIAITSVDERDGRLQVADLLGRTTISAGVRGLAFHVQREQAGDGYACPFCQYIALDPPAAQADVWVQQTGLSLERILALTVKDRLSEEDLEIAVGAGEVHADRASALVGRRLADLVRESYAQASVGAPGAGVRISAPHVSWLAGVIQAAEVYKWAAGLSQVDRRVDVDLAGLPTGLRRRDPGDPSGRCVCQSPWRRRWISNLYAT